MRSGSVTNVTGTLFRTSSTFCWAVRVNILSAFAHSIASLSSQPSQYYEDSPTYLRTFLNQADLLNAASFMAECLPSPFPQLPSPFPGVPEYFSSAFFDSVTGFSQTSAQMPPRGIYSDVTLPYLPKAAFALSRQEGKKKK